MKSGIGLTGVALRYHTDKEYRSLSKAQKQELYEWRVKERKNSKPGKVTNGADISAIVDKRVNATLRKIQERRDKQKSAKEDFKSVLISCLSEMSEEETPPKKKTKTVTVSDANTESATVSPSTLQGILKRVRNKKL